MLEMEELKGEGVKTDWSKPVMFGVVTLEREKVIDELSGTDNAEPKVKSEFAARSTPRVSPRPRVKAREARSGMLRREVVLAKPMV